MVSDDKYQNLLSLIKGNKADSQSIQQQMASFGNELLLFIESLYQNFSGQYRNAEAEYKAEMRKCESFEKELMDDVKRFKALRNENRIKGIEGIEIWDVDGDSSLAINETKGSLESEFRKLEALNAPEVYKRILNDIQRILEKYKKLIEDKTGEKDKITDGTRMWEVEANEILEALRKNEEELEKEIESWSAAVAGFHSSLHSIREKYSKNSFSKYLEALKVYDNNMKILEMERNLREMQQRIKDFIDAYNQNVERCRDGNHKLIDDYNNFVETYRQKQLKLCGGDKLNSKYDFQKLNYNNSGPIISIQSTEENDFEVISKSMNGDSTQSPFNEVEEHVSGLQSKITRVQDVITNLKRKCEEQEAIISDYEKRILELREKLADLEKEKEAASRTTEDLSRENSRLLEENEELMKEKEAASRATEELSRENSRLLAENEELLDVNTELRKKLDHMISNEAQFKELNEQLQRISEEKEAQLKELNEQLQKVFDEKVAVQEMASRTIEEQSRMSEECSKLRMEKDELSALLCDISEGRNSLEKQKELLDKDLRALTEEVSKLRNNLQVLSENNSQLADELNERNVKESIYFEELSAANDKLRKISEENSKLKQEKNALSDQLQKIFEEKEILKQERDKLSNDLCEFSNVLNMSLEEKEKEVSGAKEERDKLKDERDKLKDERDKLKDERDTLNEERDKLKDEGNRLKEELSKLSNDLRVVREEKEKLSKDLSRITSEKNAAIADLTNDIEKLAENLNDVSARYLQQVEITREKSNEIERLNATCMKLQEQLQSIDHRYSEHEGERANLEEIVRILNSEVESLRKDNEDLEKMRKENEDLRKRANESEKQARVSRGFIEDIIKTSVRDWDRVLNECSSEDKPKFLAQLQEHYLPQLQNSTVHYEELATFVLHIQNLISKFYPQHIEVGSTVTFKRFDGNFVVVYDGDLFYLDPESLRKLQESNDWDKLKDEDYLFGVIHEIIPHQPPHDDPLELGMEYKTVKATFEASQN